MLKGYATEDRWLSTAILMKNHQEILDHGPLQSSDHYLQTILYTNPFSSLRELRETESMCNYIETTIIEEYCKHPYASVYGLSLQEALELPIPTWKKMVTAMKKRKPTEISV